jgi:hypothetical protein
VRLRLDAVVREKCGGMQRAPFRWYEKTPLLLQKGAVETLIAMARQANNSLQAEFGLPLGLVIVDTVAACAGYTRAGDDNDSAVGQAVMNALKAVAQAIGCFDDTFKTLVGNTKTNRLTASGLDQKQPSTFAAAAAELASTADAKARNRRAHF